MIGYGRGPFAATGAAAYAGCMASVVLGIDIGGANLKAATADKRAVSVPFALWKEPQNLGAKLAELVAKFPDATEFAVTMTGELCDCYETKRQGVTAIVNAMLGAARSFPVRIWSTDGKFVTSDEAKPNHLKVAAANWHALATYAGGYVPNGPAILIDTGSTTTDVIPLLDGVPVARGKTDYERMTTFELIYTGVRRTPLCAILGFNGAAEFFATTLDVYLLLGQIAENPADTDTADGRPATRPYAFARMCRMLGGDAETMSADVIQSVAEGIAEQQRNQITTGVDRATYHLEALTGEVNRLESLSEETEPLPTIIASGSGEFLVHSTHFAADDAISLTKQLGPELAACAPAYALAVLATERPLERGDAMSKGRPNQ